MGACIGIEGLWTDRLADSLIKILRSTGGRAGARTGECIGRARSTCFEVSISFRRTGGYPLRHMHEVHPVCRSSVHHHDPIEQYDEKHKAGSQEARSGVARDDHCGRESRRGTRIGGRE